MVNTRFISLFIPPPPLQKYLVVAGQCFPASEERKFFHGPSSSPKYHTYHKHFNCTMQKRENFQNQVNGNIQSSRWKRQMVRKLLHYRPRRKLFLPRREKPLLVGTSYFKLLETSTAARKNSPELSFKFPRKSHANSKQRIIVRLNLLKDASECYEFMLLL